LSTANSNAEPLYNSISQANTSIGSFRYDRTFSNDIKSSITSSDFSDGYIIIGAYSSASSNNSMATISISLTITYYLPISITIDNNFVDNSSTHGQISLDGSTQNIPSSGISLTRNIGQNLTLSAISPQQDNEDYQRIWHTGSIRTSDWRRNDVFKSYNQTYSFQIASDDGDKTYMANLRKVCNLTFQGNSGTVTINSTSFSTPHTSQVVEQNSVDATASTYSANSMDYTFSNWTSGGTSYSSTVTATEHKTYTANYTAKPNNSYRSMAFNYSSVGQPVLITWVAHPLDSDSISYYAIYRKVTTQGTPTLIATVSATRASSYSYTDEEYAICDNDNKILLFYDVRAYCPQFNCYSDVYFEAVYGAININTIDSKISTTKTVNEVPKDYSISNYPNPFNPTTTISYQLPQEGFVTLKIYDILGKEVASLVNENKNAGYYNVTFDASKLTSGIYIYTINANNFVQSKKMLLVK
jgi:hypothetical protein